MPSSPAFSGPSTLGLTSFIALANTSSRFLPRLPGRSTPFPADDGRANSCGLCRDILAFVGDAKDGLRPGGVFAPSLGTGIEVVGEVLRLLEGDEFILRPEGFFSNSFLAQLSHPFALPVILIGAQSVESKR